MVILAVEGPWRRGHPHPCCRLAPDGMDIYPEMYASGLPLDSPGFRRRGGGLTATCQPNPTSSQTMDNTLGAPPGALGGGNGSQSGLE